MSLLTIGSIMLIVLVFYTLRARAYYTNSACSLGWEGTSYVRDDPELGYVPSENALARHRLPPEFTVITDDRGGRVGTPGQTAPKAVDVLAVGCSFTWGHGVDEPDTYARVLANQSGLSVYNVALASYGTPAALLSMQRYADLGPKIVVYGYIDHHKQRAICPAADSVCPFVRPTPFVDFDADDRPFIHAPIGDSTQHNQYLHDVVLDHPFCVKDVYWSIYRDYLALTRPASVRYSADDPRIVPKMENYAAWSHDPAKLRQVLIYLVGEMTAQARSMRSKLVIVYMPTADRWSPPPADLVTAIAAAQSPETLFLVDSYPALQTLAHEVGMERVFLPDGHPTAAAHARIAEILEPMVPMLVESKMR